LRKRFRTASFWWPSAAVWIRRAPASLVLLARTGSYVQLRAMHIHHGLSANADDWVAHCRQICQQWQVPLWLNG
jgi:hypothetical protein